ncbi:MAG: hypothetical protein Q4E37_05790 [Tissierellia bacterium]|nr:hypothetical protein [Tissierellia bacterium]
MWLKLNLSGLDLEFRVLNYTPVEAPKEEGPWAHVDFSCKYGRDLDYGRSSNHLLLAYEVKEIYDNLRALLDQRMEEKKEMTFCAPDYIMVLDPHPQGSPGKAAAPLEWRFSLETEGLVTRNYLSVFFDREDVVHLKDYLALVVGDIEENHPAIQEMMAEGLYY